MSGNEQTTFESVLFSRDIIEKIFSNFNVKDLRRAAGVCWYWHEMAKKELSNRGIIESLILPLYITPYNHGFCLHVEEDFHGFFECYNKVGHGRPPKEDEDLDLVDTSWHVSDAVKCVPQILIAFVDDTFETEYPFCYEYMDTLPKSSLLAEVAFSKLTVDGTEIHADTNLCAGISIPSTSNLKCKMLNIVKDADEFVDYDVDWRGDAMRVCIWPVCEILEKLDVLKTTEEHSCFIFFLSRVDMTGGQFDGSVWNYESYVNQWLKTLKERFKPGTYSVFGIGCSFNSTSLNNDPWQESNFTLFLRIYGSALKTWSAVISMDLSEEDMKNKLGDIKKEIIVNSSTIALCAIPVDENRRRLFHENSEIKNDRVLPFFDPTSLFKQVFPSVTLTCLYDDEDYNQFGCNTLDNESDPVFKHRRSMIYLFITTN